MGWRGSYYAETIGQALDELGISLTQETIAEIAEAVTISVENEGMVSGRDCIPNPLESEVRRVERLRQDDAKDADKRLTAAEKEAAYTIGQLRRRISDLERDLDAARRAA